MFGEKGRRENKRRNWEVKEDRELQKCNHLFWCTTIKGFNLMVIRLQCIKFIPKQIQHSWDLTQWLLKIDYFQPAELLSGMECTIKSLIVYGAANHFAGFLSTPFTMVHQYTFKQSYTGYAMLLMSWFWRICFALGLIPSKIINQSGTVINISVWLSHTSLINVLIVGTANLLYSLSHFCPSPLPRST